MLGDGDCWTGSSKLKTIVCFTEKPGPPSGKLRAGKVTPDSITLDWLPPLDDGGSPLTAFIIEAKAGKGQEWSVWLCVVSVPWSVWLCVVSVPVRLCAVESHFNNVAETTKTDSP